MPPESLTAELSEEQEAVVAQMDAAEWPATAETWHCRDVLTAFTRSTTSGPGKRSDRPSGQPPPAVTRRLCEKPRKTRKERDKPMSMDDLYSHCPKYYEISPQDPTPPRRPDRLPPRNVQEIILELAQDPGHGPERIEAYLRRKGHKLPLNTIRYVIVHGVTS
ncbi:hypothetical protein Acsp03_71480 [Actinomadura sp. NBRC 104412]|uniref:hypothetical protein n=1 Tax=Actinomadura sp. NBRC 104412 TaxID=3032203 RepID=UPI0024A542EE|nr:hypothetical protein [Actinomadura sp. NBRC 104412]GLZ09682.1 hypothetical protein Acsp03_71480 [Actinomadura sp. NBRC 104412]